MNCRILSAHVPGGQAACGGPGHAASRLGRSGSVMGSSRQFGPGSSDSPRRTASHARSNSSGGPRRRRRRRLARQGRPPSSHDEVPPRRTDQQDRRASLLLRSIVAARVRRARTMLSFTTVGERFRQFVIPHRSLVCPRTYDGAPPHSCELRRASRLVRSMLAHDHVTASESMSMAQPGAMP